MTHETTCAHRGDIRQVEPRTQGCEECLAAGEGWTLLRMCLVCGHVGCCDTSLHRHATRHFEQTGHAVALLLEQPDRAWCYVDQVYLPLES